MKVRLERLATDWHEAKGGYCGSTHHLHGHAERMLRECVELCMACGSNPYEVLKAVYAELAKEERRRRHTPRLSLSIDLIQEECVDVGILHAVFQHYCMDKTTYTEVIEAKLMVLEERQWVADENGVLWRPHDAY